jgi:signal peptidase I
MLWKTTYSIRKSYHILQAVALKHRQLGDRIPTVQREKIEELLQQLEHSLQGSNRKQASAFAQELEEIAGDSFPRPSIWSTIAEFPVALGVALVVAIVIRQMWFELYQIPTGSMRPTFKEQDHLIVSKATFGINVPLTPKHLYFDPDAVQRAGIVILTAEGLDVPGVDTKYFWVLPAKKRYIKRMIGKPGDSLYFYGGKIYGVDRKGEPIRELLDEPAMANLEHVPFGRFFGKEKSVDGSKYFLQANEPLARRTRSGTGKWSQEINTHRGWVKDDPLALLHPHDTVRTYADFWGIKNFAMGRLLTKTELEQVTPFRAEQLESGELYLQLFHTPHSIERGPNLFTSVIPLQQEHLDRLMDTLYTARFVVQNQKGRQYSEGPTRPNEMDAPFPDVPDGTYEFYFGKAREIGMAGRNWPISDDSPLYQRDLLTTQNLYNLGIELSLRVSPTQSTGHLPSRYVYFRDGDLYMMGAPVVKKGDPVLAAYTARERERAARHAYVPFVDHGAPVTENGEFDVAFIREFGMTVPDKHYFVLGDNHAMSGDGRSFGFVPEQNLRGTPTTLLWPWDGRQGPPPQKEYPLFTIPRMMIWGLAGALLIGWIAYTRRPLKFPVFKKLNTAL